MDPWKWPNLYVTQSGAAPFIRAMCPIIFWLIGIHFTEYMTVYPQSNYSVEQQWRNVMNQRLTFTSYRIILSLVPDFHWGAKIETGMAGMGNTAWRYNMQHNHIIPVPVTFIAMLLPCVPLSFFSMIAYSFAFLAPKIQFSLAVRGLTLLIWDMR